MIPAGTYDQIRLHVAAAEEGEGSNGAAQYSGKSYVLYDKDDDYTVVVGAYQNGNLVKETYATTRETESASGDIIPAGSYYIRGVEEGQYTLQAKVVDENGDEVLNANSEPLFTLREEKTVTVEAGNTVAAENLNLDKNQIESGI